MPLKIPRRTILIPIFTLILGLIGGFVLGIFAGAKHVSSEAWEIELSHAGRDTLICTRFLKATREGKAEAMLELGETELDVALVGLAENYTPSRDGNARGLAAVALARAREYRSAHPRQSSSYFSPKVEAALALEIPLPPSPEKITPDQN